MGAIVFLAHLVGLGHPPPAQEAVAGSTTPRSRSARPPDSPRERMASSDGDGSDARAGIDDPGLVEPGSNPTEAETSLVRSSAVVAVGTALSRVTGFVRIAAIAYALGASTLAGTYSYANEAPNIVYELLLGGVLTATLVPLFVKYFESRDDDASSAIFTVAIVALAAHHRRRRRRRAVDRRPLHAQRARARTSPRSRSWRPRCCGCFMPQMLFYGIVTLATAMLNARRRFLAAAFAPVLNNVVVDRGVPHAPPHRRRVAHRAQRARRRRADPAHRARHDRRRRGDGARAAARRSRACTRTCASSPRGAIPPCSPCCGSRAGRSGYVIANQIALLVVTVLANGTDGGPFIYISAYAFFQLPHGLFAVSLMTTFTPEMASAAARGDLAALRAQLSRGHPARGGRDRARRRAVHRRSPARSSSRCCSAARSPRPTRRRWPTRWSRSRSACCPSPSTCSRCARSTPATTRSRRSGSTASRTR